MHKQARLSRNALETKAWLGVRSSSKAVAHATTYHVRAHAMSQSSPEALIPSLLRAIQKAERRVVANNTEGRYDKAQKEARIAADLRAKLDLLIDRMNKRKSS